jgi:hypothetical protein
VEPQITRTQYTEGVSDSVDFKNVMDSKCFHLFSFNTYEHNVYIKNLDFYNFKLTHLPI